MDKYIYNEKNGLWYEVQGDYDLPGLKLPEERRSTYRRMGTAAFAVSETAPQGTLFRTADKRQAERLPCRHKRAGRGNALSAGKTACRKGGRNGSTQSRKPNAVGAEDEYRLARYSG